MTEQKEKILIKFGDEELSDLCLVVGNVEFHVHKPVLACFSKVFKTMFYGDFKEKNEERIEIGYADPLAFLRILEMIYNHEMSDEGFLRCRGRREGADEFWEQSTALWKLIDRFDIPICQKKFVKLLEKYCCTTVTRISQETVFQDIADCASCSNRLLFAIVNGLDFPYSFNLKILRYNKNRKYVPENILRLLNRIV